MPDWSYRTVFRPILFSLSAGVARDLCLRAMGTLAHLPGGGYLIDFLGHLRADRRLERSLAGITFAAPAGLGARLDPDLLALGAFARFGLGFLEVGPVGISAVADMSTVERRIGEQAIVFRNRATALDRTSLVQRLREWQPVPLPLLVRLTVSLHASPEQAGRECAGTIEQLSPHASLFAIDVVQTAIAGNWTPEAWREYCQQLLLGSTRTPCRPRLLSLPTDADATTILPFVCAAIDAGFAGAQINGEIADHPHGALLGAPARQLALTLVKRLRKELGEAPAIIASGGIHQPADALALLEAGANLLQIDSGLVYSGPGLAKRVNDAVLFAEAAQAKAPIPVPLRAVETDWLWAFLMGLGMLLGGALALVIASTRVVLPYDEDFVCMTIEQLDALNERLLAFMCHDRVSLSGTMLTIGVVYISLAGFGMRSGLHWARVAVLASAFAGFFSFFLFLGFGYFDPFHAFVTVVLFQFLLLAVHGRANVASVPQWPQLYDDWRWRWSQWGQLLLIAHGAALIAAGTTISFLGATSVFVPEDLQFMQTTADVLIAANPKLVPLVAHDRASFGGMILASGIATFLAALWGFQQGRRWLWWMLAVAGLAAYAPAILVHYLVGYINTWHLAPAYAGLAVLTAGLAISYPYLCRNQRQTEREWAIREQP